LANAPCPTQNLFATCAGKQTITRYYLPHSEMNDFNDSKKDCERGDENLHFTLEP
jgi:hypothetical protein